MDIDCITNGWINEDTVEHGGEKWGKLSELTVTRISQA